VRLFGYLKKETHNFSRWTLFHEVVSYDTVVLNIIYLTDLLVCLLYVSVFSASYQF